MSERKGHGKSLGPRIIELPFDVYAKLLSSLFEIFSPRPCGCRAFLSRMFPNGSECSQTGLFWFMNSDVSTVVLMMSSVQRRFSGIFCECTGETSRPLGTSLPYKSDHASCFIPWQTVSRLSSIRNLTSKSLFLA
jgi:hypothetical protein